MAACVEQEHATFLSDVPVAVNHRACLLQKERLNKEHTVAAIEQKLFLVRVISPLTSESPNNHPRSARTKHPGSQ